MTVAAKIRSKCTVPFLALLLFIGFFGSALAETVREPGRGSPLRAAVLEGLRPTIEDELGGPVEFVVTTLRTTRYWAFVQVDPQRPGGAPIAIDETRFAGEADMMDGLTVFALLSLEGGEWMVMEHAVGPTDVVYLDWAERFDAPPELME